MKSPSPRKSPLTPAAKAAAKAAALAGGALAAAQAADAAIVAAVNTPISPQGSFGGPGFTMWDIDGDGSTEILLSCSGWYSNDTFWQKAWLHNGAFVAPTALASGGFAKLDAGFVVGTTTVLAAGFKWYGNFGDIMMTSRGAIGSDALNNGWSLGDTGYFGFKFSNLSGTYFGWGQVNIDGDPMGAGFTILQAYYENSSGAPITVGAIPEPAHVGLLALGAAGLAAWRRRRRS